MQRGYVSLWRCMLDHSWSRHPDYVAIWVYCLLRATHKKSDIVSRGGKIIHIEPGQFITSREQISINTGVQESKVERILKVFKNDQQIEQENGGKYRIITILNWQKYQKNEQIDEQQMNSKRTANEQQMNTNNNVNKDNKENKKEFKTPSASLDAGQEEDDGYLTAKKRKLTGERLKTFNEFMDAFGDKRGRAQAADSWYDIKLTRQLFQQIMEGAREYNKARPDMIRQGKTPKMAQGWLTGRRWEDEKPVTTEKTQWEMVY